MQELAPGTVPLLPLGMPPSPYEVRWFCRWGCVVERGGLCEVSIGGTLVGQFDRSDRERGARNIPLVSLANEPTMHLGNLAKAFGVTEEYLRLLRRKAEKDGLGAVVLKRMGGQSKVSSQQRVQLHAWFAEGLNPTDAFRMQGRKRGRLSRATISRERVRWQAERVTDAAGTTIAAAPPEEVVEAAAAAAAIPQTTLYFPATTAESSENDGCREPPEVTVVDEIADVVAAAVSNSDVAGKNEGEEQAQAQMNADDDGNDDANGARADDEPGRIVPMRSRPVQSKRMVQHLGTWLMMALAQKAGLHDTVAACGADGDAERIALDATIAALAIGERCVEGVRRLQTPTVTALLRSDRAPTASSVRRRLWSLAKEHGAALAGAMSERYIAAARGDADAPAIFYVDGHLRPYTGQEVVRKGWRMQDRCVLPGTSDYYVHDEDGRPVFRIAVPSHDSLTQWLMPIAERLRAGLGSEERILLAFDRGGAFPEQMAALRDADFEFVTYERKPYPTLLDSAFDRTIEVRGETYRVHESRLKNLDRGRGRVRRIALRCPDGAQINLMAISTLPLEALVAILVGGQAEHEASGRWQQENAFKHGIERWGINQLDGRKVDDYPPDTIIPNPARRRLDRALRLARSEEGAARCALAKLPADSPRRESIERDLHDAVKQRVVLELLRPFLPTHAPLAETELAGKLVRHTGELKAVVDTIRIVCANVETDLAGTLAPHLLRPAEAKKLLANLFAAPGRIDVTPDSIRIHLAPAANRSEREAIGHLLAEVSRWNLTLPGDARLRPLRVRLQSS